MFRKMENAGLLQFVKMIKKMIPKSLKKKCSRTMKLFSSQTRPVVIAVPPPHSEDMAMEEITNRIGSLRISNLAGSDDHSNCPPAEDKTANGSPNSETNTVVMEMVTNVCQSAPSNDESIARNGLTDGDLKVNSQDTQTARQSQNKKKLKSAKELHSAKRAHKSSNQRSSKSASVQNVSRKKTNGKREGKQSLNHGSRHKLHSKKPELVKQKDHSAGKRGNDELSKNISCQSRARVNDNQAASKCKQKKSSKSQNESTQDAQIC